MTYETDGSQPDPSSSLLAFFGGELRKRRMLRGWSQEETAKHALSTGAMISYVENSKRVPSEELARGLDRAFETDFFSSFRPLVVSLAYPSWFLPYVALEREATSIRSFESQIVSGLLQTEDYARRVLASGRPDQLDALVAARMTRQSLLERSVPPRAWFVMDENVLTRHIGGPDVMRVQLERLLTLGEQPRVVIQVVPRSVAEHPGVGGPFNLLSFDEGPDVLYVDGFPQGRTALAASEVSEAAHAYDLLRAVALSPEASADLIGTHLKELNP